MNDWIDDKGASLTIIDVIVSLHQCEGFQRITLFIVDKT